jgi:cytochrome P450 family 4
MLRQIPNQLTSKLLKSNFLKCIHVILLIHGSIFSISAIISDRFFTATRNNLIFKLSGQERKQNKILKILHNFTDSVIVARREELSKKLKEDKHEEKIDDDIGSKKKLALLDVLLQSTINEQPLSNLDIREEVDTFVFEGHDTTTSGIAFCLYNLAKHPEVQQKVYEEIKSVIGEDVEKPVTQKDLNDLSYLELVIKETLRLYPSVPFFGRKIHEDVEISECF